ncbi:MAG: dihydropteroate synthase [Fibrobacteria bacterium]|nr:dihydropteroate synthase [Fibrobacteria bacterium]
MAGAWRIRGTFLRPRDALDRPLVVGILNTTPDSFHDGGRYPGTDAAVAQGMRLWQEGADLLDVGGESTRPGAAPVGCAEEMARAIPVVQALVEQGALVSIDTRNSTTARAALAAGAHALNDVSGLSDPDMIALCREFGAGACAMHMRGTPATMQQDPTYDDVVAEVGDHLEAVALRWEDAGLPAEALALDPGIGFGKSGPHNLALLRATEDLRLRFLPRPWYLGLSRKSFIARTPGVPPDSDRFAGSLGAALAAAHLGCDILRVHDVAATLEALRLYRTILPTPP